MCMGTKEGKKEKNEVFARYSKTVRDESLTALSPDPVLFHNALFRVLLGPP